LLLLQTFSFFIKKTIFVSYKKMRLANSRDVFHDWYEPVARISKNVVVFFGFFFMGEKARASGKTTLHETVIELARSMSLASVPQL
jgi:hypothetical protein